MSEAAIRVATSDDIPSMIRLAEEHRRELSSFQPMMWREAAKASEKQAGFFTHQIAQENVIALVAQSKSELAGFAIGSLVGAPPVYSPGGLTLLIDDFAIAGGERWDGLGKTLVQELTLRAKAAGAVQAVVICPHLLSDKREFLGMEGFEIASEWWVRSL